jgi:hypothetical protein
VLEIMVQNLGFSIFKFVFLIGCQFFVENASAVNIPIENQVDISGSTFYERNLLFNFEPDSAAQIVFSGQFQRNVSTHPFAHFHKLEESLENSKNQNEFHYNNYSSVLLDRQVRSVRAIHSLSGESIEFVDNYPT